MKKIYSILSLTLGLLLLLTACGDGTEFTLSGNLGTEKGKYILAVYDDPLAKVDTIFPEKGKFEYVFIPDTITLMRLVDEDGHVIPVFADKGWTVSCQGSFSQPQIEGDGPNKDYQEFRNSIGKIEDANEILQKAEEFIRSHPKSFASAYLINHYFIQTPQPDFAKINSLITPLNGEIKDSRVLNVALKAIPSVEETEKTHLSYFSITNRNGEYLTWDNRKGKIILINFWASWDPKSIQARDALEKTIALLPKGKIKVFNVSLDYDKSTWLKFCWPDTENWTEICDFKGWESPLIKKNNILSLPSNILIDNHRKILDRNIYGKALADKVNEQTE